MNILFFDTETTGLPLWREPSDDPKQPHIVDIAVDLVTDGQEVLESYDAIINNGVDIPEDVAEIHGITTEIAADQGVEPAEAHDNFMGMVAKADLISGYNVNFDIRMVRMMAAKLTGEKWTNPLEKYCTMYKSMPHTGERLTLGKTYRHFFDEEFQDAHRARPDCDAARRIYFHLKSLEQS